MFLICFSVFSKVFIANASSIEIKTMTGANKIGKIISVKNNFCLSVMLFF